MNHDELTINVAEMKHEVLKCFDAGLVPMVTSSPGMGKSDVIRQVAKERNLYVIDVRLAQCDPTEINGFPHIVEVGGEKVATYVPMDIFPIESTPIPDGYDGFCLFLDELPSAPPMVQNAAYKLILDKAIGTHHLHPKCYMVAAGNSLTDNAFVSKVGTALQSRMVHYGLNLDVDLWLNWATAHQVDYRIIGFINYQRGNLHKFDPNHNDKTFPCPRTWEFVSRGVKGEPQLSHKDIPFIAGCIGEGMARQFVGYCEVFPKLPSYKAIINGTAKAPTEPSVMFAVSALIGEQGQKQDLQACIDFTDQMGPEFTVITLRQMVGRDATVLMNPVVVRYMQSTGREIFLDN